MLLPSEAIFKQAILSDKEFKLSVNYSQKMENLSKDTRSILYDKENFMQPVHKIDYKLIVKYQVIRLFKKLQKYSL